MLLIAEGLPRHTGNLQGRRIQGTGRDKILVINVNGLISSGETVLIFPSPDMVEVVKSRLRIAEKDKNIKAVILKVDSPGGTVLASDEIFKEITAFKKKTGKPVISLMGSVAASGGYYISMACDRIVAHKATITGSIGVIMQFLNYKGLSDKYGLRWESITPENARLKDIGSPSKEMSEEERQVFKAMVEEMYTLFLDRVKSGRKNLSEEKILELADGRPYTGSQAAELGLVDLLGDLDTAIEEARKIKGLGSDPTVMEYHPVTTFSRFFGRYTGGGAEKASPTLGDLARSFENGTFPRLYYLYLK
jgi:protease-4